MGAIMIDDGAIENIRQDFFVHLLSTTEGFGGFQEETGCHVQLLVFFFFFGCHLGGNSTSSHYWRLGRSSRLVVMGFMTPRRLPEFLGGFLFAALTVVPIGSIGTDIGRSSVIIICSLLFVTAARGWFHAVQQSSDLVKGDLFGFRVFGSSALLWWLLLLLLSDTLRKRVFNLILVIGF